MLKTNALTQVQVLIGSGCTTGGAMDADKWQSIAKLPAFAGYAVPFIILNTTLSNCLFVCERID